MTLVTNLCLDAVFQKALQRFASREIDDFDVVFFQIYWSIYVLIIISLWYVLEELLQK